MQVCKKIFINGNGCAIMRFRTYSGDGKEEAVCWHFIGYGIYAACSKKEVPFGFWANAAMVVYTTVIEPKYRDR